MSTDEARLQWADCLKGLLIVFVVFWHVTLKTYLQIDWHISLPIPGVWGFASDVIWMFMLPAFVLLSGFFAADALRRPWSQVFRGKAARYLYLFVLWTLIHIGAMWPFPSFPTFIPRSFPELLEALTISPPNTWYLLAMALYFVVAKMCRRVPPVVLIIGAAAVSVYVQTGAIDGGSNRAAVLYNFTFFLLGAYGRPLLLRLVGVRGWWPALAVGASFVVAFAAMRATNAEKVPGVWPAVSALGVAGLVMVGPRVAGLRVVGDALGWLGRRSLVIYVVHMPILVVLDAIIRGSVSEAPNAVQMPLAVVLPMVLTVAVVGLSVGFDHLVRRDRLTWLLDLPRLHGAKRPESRSGAARLPWRSLTAAAATVAVATSVVTLGAPQRPRSSDIPHFEAERPGEVSIGAGGDILLEGAGGPASSVADVDYLERVRPWFTQDVVTANLEQPITGSTEFDKCGSNPNCFSFRSEPGSEQALTGFDVVNLANNHSRDFGSSGFEETRSNLERASIESVGLRNEITYLDVDGTMVAIIGFAPYSGFNRVTDLRHVEEVVRAASREADIVVVHSHMGAEGPTATSVAPGVETAFGENRGDPRAFAHTAVNAGADLIIGHGPHVVRGIELYRGRLIAYSLGNFAGGGTFGAEDETRSGAYLDVRLATDGALVAGSVQAVTFDAESGRPEPDSERRALDALNERGPADFGPSAVTVDEGGTLEIPSAPDAREPWSRPPSDSGPAASPTARGGDAA